MVSQLESERVSGDNQLADHSNKWRHGIQSRSVVGEMNTAQIPQGDPKVFWLDFAALYIIPLDQWIFINRDVRVDVATANQSSKYLNIENPPADERISKCQSDRLAGCEHFCSALRVVNRHS